MGTRKSCLPFLLDPLGRMSREWFQGGHCGAKIQISPAPLIYKKKPCNWLHSAIFSLQKESTSFFSVSDCTIPISGIQTSQEPEEHKHPYPQHTAVGTGPVEHQLSLHSTYFLQPLPSTRSYQDPVSRVHHMDQRTQEPQCTLQPRTMLGSLLWEPQHTFTTSAATLGARYR